MRKQRKIIIALLLMIGYFTVISVAPQHITHASEAMKKFGKPAYILWVLIFIWLAPLVLIYDARRAKKTGEFEGDGGIIFRKRSPRSFKFLIDLSYFSAFALLIVAIFFTSTLVCLWLKKA